MVEQKKKGQVHNREKVGGKEGKKKTEKESEPRCNSNTASTTTVRQAEKRKKTNSTKKKSAKRTGRKQFDSFFCLRKHKEKEKTVLSS